MSNKAVHIFGGGTVAFIREHLALSAPAYGTTARRLAGLCKEQGDRLDVVLHLTRMADPENGTIETNEDLAREVQHLVGVGSTKIIFFNAAVVDYEPGILSQGHELEFDVSNTFGKHATRVRTDRGSIQLLARPTRKILRDIRKERKDIFLVAFKATAGATEQEQYIAGLNLLKGASCNLVLANDTVTRRNMIITPEEARYHVTLDRDEALRNLVEMAYLRSHLTFTRSTVVDGQPVGWDDPRVPETLRQVVDHCIRRGAYKPFRGATVGHFAVKLGDNLFLTSRRKTNFNDLARNGLVMVRTDGPDHVIAYGSRPSVGGQSQRIVFDEHPGYDCIVHFHCPKRAGSKVPSVSQREYECGSMQCGKNTSDGLAKFENLSCVYLENHGPNIVFHSSINSNEVIDFIETNFDLSDKTGGPVYVNECSSNSDG